MAVAKVVAAAKAATEAADAELTVVWSDDQAAAIAAALRGVNMMLTGAAGSGKTAVVHEIRTQLERRGRKVAVTATTGIAAINVEGRTLHSYLRIGPSIDAMTLEEVARDVMQKRGLATEVKACSTLIIDEVSMMSPDLFCKVNVMLQTLRVCSKPFGGIQVILVGDFAQLPPVTGSVVPMHAPRLAGVKRARPAIMGGVGGDDDSGSDSDGGVAPPPSSRFIFGTNLFYETIAEVHDLRVVWRQSDPVFIALLARARVGALTADDYALLATRMGDATTVDLGEAVDGIKPTRLFARNADVDRINTSELAAIREPTISYAMRTGICVAPTVRTKQDKEIAERVLTMVRDKTKKDLNMPETVELKVGAQVYLSFNLDQAGGLVNGSRGVVVGFTGGAKGAKAPKADPESAFALPSSKLDEPLLFPAERMPVVRFKGKAGRMRTIEVPYVRWKREERRHGEAYVWQVPLKLAWATSIHKAQGLSLDRVEMSLDATVFEEGQAYVALSRVRSLSGLRITTLAPDVFRACAEVVRFYETPFAEAKAAWVRAKCDKLC